MSQVVSANRLSDGLVVYLCHEGAEASWSLDLELATVADTDERAAELLALGVADAETRHEAVDPYLIEVVEEGGRRRPTKYRELIRCLGPTIRSDLGKQAEGPEA
ncbi:MAG: DUF2849 domain-containing protein [Deltaproteobacteria bacterium]|jgi:hypothetical protein|nr:DUF2849 domain-containing protein [Deltaproteobacteria bacterium]